MLHSFTTTWILTVPAAMSVFSRQYAMSLSGWKERVDITQRRRRKRVIYQTKDIHLSKVHKHNLGGCGQNHGPET